MRNIFSFDVVFELGGCEFLLKEGGKESLFTEVVGEERRFITGANIHLVMGVIGERGRVFDKQGEAVGKREGTDNGEKGAGLCQIGRNRRSRRWSHPCLTLHKQGLDVLTQFG
jgi:hypothetical protein